MFAPKKAKHEILLAHGGDDKHIPIKKDVMNSLGYDYVALGHIHKPQVLVENRVLYAGALEPIDKNDVGPHGYVKVSITDKGVTAEFVSHAQREYVHMTVSVDESMTNGAVNDLIRDKVQQYGSQNIYKFVLQGFRDTDIVFDLESMKNFGNIIEVLDETKPSYDIKKLMDKNSGNLLGKFIESFQGYGEEGIEQMALYEGVQALMETKRG